MHGEIDGLLDYWRVWHDPKPLATRLSTAWRGI
jgi:hypothetical protein